MNKVIITGVSCLAVGIIVGGIIAGWAVNGNHKGALKVFGIQASKVVGSEESSKNTNTSMDNMMAALDGKTGDAFDKAFISEMIVHHQGAIDMAKLAQTNAKHDEIKRMASDIITAQTKEIEHMKAWQTEWRYTDNSSNHSMH